jgi:shikimate 5-dehydrogenase
MVERSPAAAAAQAMLTTLQEEQFAYGMMVARTPPVHSQFQKEVAIVHQAGLGVEGGEEETEKIHVVINGTLDMLPVCPRSTFLHALPPPMRLERAGFS